MARSGGGVDDLAGNTGGCHPRSYPHTVADRSDGGGGQDSYACADLVVVDTVDDRDKDVCLGVVDSRDQGG